MGRVKQNDMKNTKDFDTMLTNTIINDNYAVQSSFDDVSEGLTSSKHLSKAKANEILKTKKRGCLTSYNVVECLAVVGIVPFNSGLAYVFNKALPTGNIEDPFSITGNTYESLMGCYVYSSQVINKKILDNLTTEYHKRGGVIYEDYHSFENLELRKDRQSRQVEYRNNIVFNSIFKHGFKETGKNKWSDGSVTIKQKDVQRSVMKYTSVKTHTELYVTLDKMMLIGSVFAPFLQGVNQLSKESFGIVCNKISGHKYYFTYFEIEFTRKTKRYERS